MLDRGEVHVWRAALDVSPERLAGLAASLSQEELRRAERFRSAEVAARFIAGRGISREILGRYLRQPPNALGFVVGEQGKPALAGDGAWLHYNVSNSAGLMLLACASGRQVGVDLEEIRPVPEALAIADRMLSPAERERLGALPGEHLQEAFLHCWTRKEAYIKALGRGLWTGLDTFDVSFGPHEEPRILAIHGDASSAGRWALRALDPGAGWLGAVVVEEPLTSLRTLQWPG
jgi:4'-phosphopantetheinyl transferase